MRLKYRLGNPTGIPAKINQRCAPLQIRYRYLICVSYYRKKIASIRVITDILLPVKNRYFSIQNCGTISSTCKPVHYNTSLSKFSLFITTETELRQAHIMSSQVDRIKPDSFGIITYLENLRRGNYQIPTFQREVVWEQNQVKQLWDSIRKFYPLGSILVWRTQTVLQNHREIGGHQLNEPEQYQEFNYLLDGQQRTTALLTSVYGGHLKGWKGRNTKLYIDLTVQEADEVEDETWQKRFLFWDEIDDQEGKVFKNSGRKRNFEAGVIVELEDIVKQYSHLERKLSESGYSDYDATEREGLRAMKEVFDNYKLSFIELRGIEVAEVCQIFERINQAGQPLSMFDIVVAKTYRPGTDEKPGILSKETFPGIST